MRSAVLLTCYNRPTLVVDAIASVLEQQPCDWRLIIMDDGCDARTRAAIATALARHRVTIIKDGATHRPDGLPLGHGAQFEHVVWWQGPDRPMHERKAKIPYSRTINLALNYLLSDERFVTYICDDDFLLPDSIVARADYLDAHPDVAVVYGRLSSVQFDAAGFNTWQTPAAPTAGRRWLVPDGHRSFNAEAGNARTYFLGDKVDPVTGLSFVEEGFWLAGPFTYGERYRVDHNQVMHRRSCLRNPIIHWAGQPAPAEGFVEYWPEANHWGVGDAGFFQALAAVYPFVGVDCWAARKRYHALSDGVSHAEVRE